MSFKETISMNVGGSWKKRGLLFLLYVSLGIVIFFLLLGHVKPKSYEYLKVGDRSADRIVSPIHMEDELATDRAKNRAANEIHPVYTQDNEIIEDQKRIIEAIYEKVKEINANAILRQNERIEEIKKQIPQLTEESYKTLADLSPETIFIMKSITTHIVEGIMKKGVADSEEALNAARDQVNEQLVSIELSAAARKVTQEIARLSIVSNIVYDQNKTQEMRDEARKAIETVYINEGDLILDKNDIVTSEHLRKLTLLGLMETNKIKPYIGLVLFILMILAMIWFYTHQSKSIVVGNNLQLFMYVVIIILNLLVMKILTLFKNLEFQWIGYLAPVAFGSIMIAMLIGTRLAYFSSFLFALMAGVLFNEDPGQIFSFNFVLVSFIGSVVGAYVVSGAQSRSKILKAGFLVALANITVMIMQFLLHNQGGDLHLILNLVLFCVISGLLSGVFALGFMPFFEVAFGILSPIKLIELSNPNQPLLRKLLLETPGTYHHSVMVANLSEAACEAVGANGLLARVGSYYHDIGKTKRPSFFIENQMGNDNPHDSIAPQLSKSIIVAHPYDGVKMLKEHKLPKAICDIAEQHHGTSLLKFFYHKAKNENEHIKEEDFRYPGPKAQFKEVAIVGICDSVEAAVRSMNKPTIEQIESVVRKIIKDKLDDGQLDECDLTLKELDVVHQTIIETLKGTFHSRIEYPNEAEMGVKEA